MWQPLSWKNSRKRQCWNCETTDRNGKNHFQTLMLFTNKHMKYIKDLVLNWNYRVTPNNGFTNIEAFNPSIILFFFSLLPNISFLKSAFFLCFFISQSVSSAVQSCLTLCDPMDCSTPGPPVHHQLPELAQTHVHWVGDAIQPSHPLSFPSPPAFSLSQHQGLFQRVSSSHQVAKVLEFQLQHQSFQWTPRTDLL